MVGWLHCTGFCLVAKASNDILFDFPEANTTNNSLYGMLPTDVVGFFGSRRMCVFGCTCIFVALLPLDVAR